jgi:GNAT superfamily N-acetyltransferase
LDGLVDDALAVLEHLSWIEHLPEGAIFPLLPFWAGSEALIEEALLAKHWRCSFEQTAMFLPLSLSQGSGSNTASDSNTAQRRPGFQVGTVTSLEQVQQWADIGGEAFAYDIDPGVIETLLEDGDIQLLLGWNNDIAIACGLLFKTGDTIGVHQVGVRQDFQGQGFARSFMLELISASTAWQGKNLVLQASEAGKPLYESLGFRTQFLIRNFQRLPV